MLGTMKNSDIDGAELHDGAHLSIECSTCVATGTTACADCVVSHLLANDDGPIELVTVSITRPRTATDRAIALFQRAGLVGDPVEFVSPAEFEQGFEHGSEQGVASMSR
jgi:hypothetical protein